MRGQAVRHHGEPPRQALRRQRGHRFTITRPPRGADIRPALVEHALLLNDLFVGLAEAPLKKALGTRAAEIPRRRHRSAADGLYLNAQALPFKWIASDSVRLPWKEYRDGDSIDRIIHPDAVLELPGLRRRLFLEAETGSHTIVPRGYHKPGSTLNKASPVQGIPIPPLSQLLETPQVPSATAVDSPQPDVTVAAADADDDGA